MSPGSTPLTYTDLQRATDAFVITRLEEQPLPELPSERDLAKYRQLLTQDFAQVVALATEHIKDHQNDVSHGLPHLWWVGMVAGWLAEKECIARKLDTSTTDQIIRQTVLAGFLHDIDRNIGRGPEHMAAGAKTAEAFFKEVGLDYPEVIEVIAHHDELGYDCGESTVRQVVFGSVFDADHFLYGLERQDRFWKMRADAKQDIQFALQDYHFLEKFLPSSAWRTTYGKVAGPLFIEFGIAIAKHCEEQFGVK